jgi:hypothetical protein
MRITKKKHIYKYTLLVTFLVSTPLHSQNLMKQWLNTKLQMTLHHLSYFVLIVYIVIYKYIQYLIYILIYIIVIRSNVIPLWNYYRINVIYLPNDDVQCKTSYFLSLNQQRSQALIITLQVKPLIRKLRQKKKWAWKI